MSDIKEGDHVKWNWGSGQPGGVVEEVKEDGKLTIESKGKQVSKNADPENPAVKVARSGNPVVKRASELQKTSPGEGKGDTLDGTPKKAKQNESSEQDGEAKAEETPNKKRKSDAKDTKKTTKKTKKSSVSKSANRDANDVSSRTRSRG